MKQHHKTGLYAPSLVGRWNRLKTTSSILTQFLNQIKLFTFPKITFYFIALFFTLAMPKLKADVAIPTSVTVTGYNEITQQLTIDVCWEWTDNTAKTFAVGIFADLNGDGVIPNYSDDPATWGISDSDFNAADLAANPFPLGLGPKDEFLGQLASSNINGFAGETGYFPDNTDAGIAAAFMAALPGVFPNPTETPIGLFPYDLTPINTIDPTSSGGVREGCFTVVYENVSVAPSGLCVYLYDVHINGDCTSDITASDLQTCIKDRAANKKHKPITAGPGYNSDNSDEDGINGGVSCADLNIVLCNLAENTTTTQSNNDGTYTVTTSVIGMNGNYTITDNTGNAILITSNPTPLILTAPSDVPSTLSGAVSITYNLGDDYDFTISENGSAAAPPNPSNSSTCTIDVSGCAHGTGGPCLATRWTKGDAWSDIGGTDGTIDEGVIACANAAATQSNISPNTTYCSSTFTLPTLNNCINPDNGMPVSLSLPVEGQPVLWFNFDVRALAGSSEFQVIGGPDNIGWALFYSNDPTNSNTGGPNGDLSGDCSDISYDQCGTNFTGWSDTPFSTPNLGDETNYYLMVWDQDGGDFSINFKARNGCGAAVNPSLEIQKTVYAGHDGGTSCPGRRVGNG